MKLADLATGSDWIVWIVFVIFAVLSIILLSEQWASMPCSATLWARPIPPSSRRSW